MSASGQWSLMSCGTSSEAYSIAGLGGLCLQMYCGENDKMLLTPCSSRSIAFALIQLAKLLVCWCFLHWLGFTWQKIFSYNLTWKAIMKLQLNHAVLDQLYLLGVFQRGVSVVWRFQAPQPAGVKVSTAVDELPRHSKLLLQQFIECKGSWIKVAES